MDIEGHLSQWLAKELGEALASNLLVESAVNIYAAQLDDLAVESSICAVVSSLRGGRALLLLAQSPLRLLHSAPVLSAEATEDGGGEGAVSMHAMLLNKIHSLEVWCGEAEWGSLMAALALTAQESGEGGREEACYQRVTSHALAMRMAGLGKGGPPISPLAQVTAAVLNALHGGGGEAGAVSGEELEAVREGARYPRVREAIVDAALDAVLAASRGPGDDALDARVIRALSCAHQLTVVPAPWVAGAPGAAELAETLRDLSVRFSFVSAEYLLALASSLQELVVASERWHRAHAGSEWAEWVVAWAAPRRARGDVASSPPASPAAAPSRDSEGFGSVASAGSGGAPRTGSISGRISFLHSPVVKGARDTDEDGSGGGDWDEDGGGNWDGDGDADGGVAAAAALADLVVSQRVRDHGGEGGGESGPGAIDDGQGRGVGGGVVEGDSGEEAAGGEGNEASVAGEGRAAGGVCEKEVVTGWESEEGGAVGEGGGVGSEALVDEAGGGGGREGLGADPVLALMQSMRRDHLRALQMAQGLIRALETLEELAPAARAYTGP